MSILHFDIFQQVDAPFFHKEHHYFPGPVDQYALWSDMTVTCISCMHSSRINTDILDIFPNLRLVVTRTVWMDHIDVTWLNARWVQVASVGQYGPHVIAAHAFTLLLSWARDLFYCVDQGRRGEYDYSWVHAIDLAGKVLWVIWVGNIGKHILRLGKAFSMQLLWYDISEDSTFQDEVGLEYCSLDEIYTKSDVIILACNLTDKNRHMINARAIQAMKEGVILINIARWELIDEADLIQSHDKFSFIWLDVIQDESLQWVTKFASCQNIMMTPHIAHFADSTVETRWRKTYDIINNSISLWKPVSSESAPSV